MQQAGRWAVSIIGFSLVSSASINQEDSNTMRLGSESGDSTACPDLGISSSFPQSVGKATR